MSDKKNESFEEKEQLADGVRMKNVRRNIKIRKCAGRLHREKLSRNRNL